MEKIGLVAGGGELPLIFAKEAKKKGVKVIGFGLKDVTSPELGAACDRAHWFATNQFKKFVILFLAERIRKVVMLGKLDKSVIYNSPKKKSGMPDFLKKAGDKSDYSLLEKATSEFKKVGVEVIDGLEYLNDLVPRKGILTKRTPLPEENEDISFGFSVAKELAKFDIGQTVVVRDKTIVSVEAMEGTDETVKRAGKICDKGFVVVKVARPHQDMRWDVPLVGPETISVIAAGKGKVLAIEDKSMYMMEKDTCLKLADRHGISIVVL